MKKNKGLKVVRVTPEDDEYIEELYKKITGAYKSAAALAGVNPTTGKKWQGPKIRDVVSFLREHAVYGDREIQNFADRFVK
jgi:hypothetical protein